MLKDNKDKFTMKIFFSLIFLYSLALSQETITEEKFKFGGEIRIRGEYRAESDFNTLTGSNTNSIPQRIRLNLTTPLIEKTKNKKFQLPQRENNGKMFKKTV